MNSQEIEALTNKVYLMFGAKIGLPKEKVKKCVQAIAALNDPEIDQRLKKLL